MEEIVSTTCSAPVNIAVIKYWGKRNEDIVLPYNSSISVTLNKEGLRTKTTVAVSKTFTEDRMWLNGVKQNVGNKRIQNVLNGIRRRARKRKFDDSSQEVDDNAAMQMLNWKIHICSENNFPTAAGLASSAAGYACLVYSLAKLFDVHGEISSIARCGSGSACRSIYGGFVKWEKGDESDGSDSIAKPIFDHTHWPGLRILLLVVSDQVKPISSTEGMQVTVETSQLYKHRVDNLASSLKKMEKAIEDKDFEAFAELTMKDSNQLHSVCLDTYPPICYLTDTSRKIISLVHKYNKMCSKVNVAYTFDAGPNACVFLMDEDVPRFLSLVAHLFPPDSNVANDFIRGFSADVENPLQADVDHLSMDVMPGGLQYIIYTKPGNGPEVIEDPDQSLLGGDGLPVYLQDC